MNTESNQSQISGMQPGDSAFIPFVCDGGFTPMGSKAYYDFIVEFDRNKWGSKAELRTENGVLGMMVWRTDKKRTGKETDYLDVMQQVVYTLHDERAPMTFLVISRACLKFRRLNFKERKQLMDILVKEGYCLEWETSRGISYRSAP